MMASSNKGLNSVALSAPAAARVFLSLIRGITTGCLSYALKGKLPAGLCLIIIGTEGGTKGRLTCLFAARRVRVADGHKHRMLDNRMQCMPGDEVWLVGERRSTGEQKYYVSNLPADASLKMLAATIKARWICEQAHQQLKEELGLDHLSWTGLHRHALMTMIAYAFLQSRRLKAAGRKKKSRGTAATTEHAGHQASHPRPLRTASTQAMPPL